LSRASNVNSPQARTKLVFFIVTLNSGSSSSSNGSSHNNNTPRCGNDVINTIEEFTKINAVFVLYYLMCTAAGGLGTINISILYMKKDIEVQLQRA
jgi:hypothetical protein